MAIRIKLDSANHPEDLHLILATRGGNLIGALPMDSIKFTESMTDGSEISFNVCKESCTGDYIDDSLWNKIQNFKLAYCPEIDLWYELNVTTNETNTLIKNVVATSLGEVELSQINVYDIEINTEDDIARDEYVPTVLYNESNPEASLIDRLLYKVPHYRIKHVDTSIANIQRTFSFDGKSVRDAFNDVAEEIDCIFVLACRKTDERKIDRAISVYDLENHCNACGARGDFIDKCEKCGSTEITFGFGHDTTIFVSPENLAEEIEYSTNVDEVKNCFRLEAGDDLMTATIVNCNPNGSQYIWYITDWMKEDMSPELSDRLDSYNEMYENYQNTYNYQVDESVLSSYNWIVRKYAPYKSDLNVLPYAITGYAALMNAYYDTIDFELFLENALMPSVDISPKTAETEALRLTEPNLSPVAVADLDSCTASAAANAALGVAKCFVDASFQVKVNDSSYDSSSHEWTGNFKVTNYSDEEDVAFSRTVTLVIDDDILTYTQQKIEKILSQDDGLATDISSLFKLEQGEFEDELKKYSRQRLLSFKTSCQGCIDILIEQGAADKSSWADTQDTNVYDDLYLPYLDKMAAIEAELKVRSYEIEIVAGSYDDTGALLNPGMKSEIARLKNETQSALDFEAYLGDELLYEFVSYRREDMFDNSNYISDGLNNAELFSQAIEFLEAAQKEIYKSAMLQHTITATLGNLLVMPEFSPIVDYFQIGNWIRVKTDGRIFRLRLASYDIDYESMELSVEFTDAKPGYTYLSDIQSILDSARSMSTSYGSVKRQALKGKASNDILNEWASNGFSLTTNIVGGADNQEFVLDKSGYTGRKYIQESDSYSDEQIKIINNGIYVTDDGWLTASAGLGKFRYFNPRTNLIEDGFGVIAKQLVGNVLLANDVGVYNKNGSISINEDGITLTTNADDNTTVFMIQRESNGTLSPIMYVNANGKLVLDGEAIVGTLNASNITISNISADSITSGIISADRIDAGSIDVDKLSGKLENGSWIIDLTHETFDIGELDAGSITSGTLDDDRLSQSVSDSLGYADYSNEVFSGTQTANYMKASAGEFATLSIDNTAVQKLSMSVTTPTGTQTIYYFGYTINS